MPPILFSTDDLIICKACGTQYNVTTQEGKSNCEICDVSLPAPWLPLLPCLFIHCHRGIDVRLQDPRQYVPPSGQSWTTLSEMRKEGYRNVWKEDEVDGRILSICTEKKVFMTSFRIFSLQLRFSVCLVSVKRSWRSP